MYEFGFVSAMNEVAREGNVEGSCIDHIFIKPKINLINIRSMLVKVDVTDHYSVISEIKKPGTRSAAWLQKSD